MANPIRNRLRNRHPKQLETSLVALISLFLLVLVATPNAVAQPGGQACFDEALNEGPPRYLREQKQYNYAVIYSICWAGKNSKLILLLPLSNHNSLDDILGGPREPPPRPKGGREAGVPMLYYFYKGCVTNAASLKVEKDALKVVDYAQGGVWQADRLGDAADELVSFPLVFLPPAKLMNALKAKPHRQCRSLTQLSPEVP